MSVVIRTGERFELRETLKGELHDHRVPTVEVWIGGRKFSTDCRSDEEARDLVVLTAIELGVRR